jgi:hypothetical protein
LRWVAFTASLGAWVLPTLGRVVLHAVEVLLHACTGQSSRASDAGKGPERPDEGYDRSPRAAGTGFSRRTGLRVLATVQRQRSEQ